MRFLALSFFLVSIFPWNQNVNIGDTPIIYDMLEHGLYHLREENHDKPNSVVKMVGQKCLIR